MWESIVTFFSQKPPSLDAILVPWSYEFIAGNVIIITATWAILRYIAKLTPWAEDDKIIQIITGGVTAVRDAISPLVNKNKVITKTVERKDCDHKLNSPDAEVCEKCGRPL